MNYKDKYVGIKILGFCNGFFGRDDYEDKVIIASGDDWLIAKDGEGETHFAHFNNGWKEDMERYIEEWSSLEHRVF